MTQPTCYIHSDSEAVSTCVECFRPICSVCRIEQDLRYFCPRCLKKARHLQLFKKVLTILIASLIFSSLAYVVLFRRLPFLTYGKYRSEIRNLKSYLEKERCDRGKIVRLGDLYIQVGDYRSALNRSHQFFEECGDYPRLLWVTYTAHKYLSEWDEAIADATKLIESRPYDKDYRWWRGLAYEEKGELEKAVADYRQTLSITPQLTNIPFNLADVYERLDRPCDAIFPLEQFLYYHPDTKGKGQVRQRINTLYQQGQCGDLIGVGKALITFSPSAHSIQTFARVNGTKEGQFIVDTGATYVVLTNTFARQLGLKKEDGLPIFIDTVNGVQEAHLITVNFIELQGVRASRVDCVIVDTLPNNVDGLLGLSFLSRFNVDLDLARGELKVEAKSNSS